MLKEHVRVSWCFLLFFFVFGLMQLMHALIYFCLPPEWLKYFVNLLFQIACSGAVLLLIKKGNSDFKEHGFWWPDNSGKYLSVSMLFALAHVFITVFLPGSLFGFELSPPTHQPLLEIMIALFASLASESVFRGYIQRNLMRVYGFLPVLTISSFLFSLYGLQLSSLLSSDITFLFTDIASFFITGVFLGLFFQKTMTLICPVTFYAVLPLLHRLTPLNAVATGYVALFFEVIAYVFLITLVYVLAMKKFWEQ